MEFYAKPEPEELKALEIGHYVAVFGIIAVFYVLGTIAFFIEYFMGSSRKIEDLEQTVKFRSFIYMTNRYFKKDMATVSGYS